jgi:hypothetical protein
MPYKGPPQKQDSILSGTLKRSLIFGAKLRVWPAFQNAECDKHHTKSFIAGDRRRRIGFGNGPADRRRSNCSIAAGEIR